jgi:hypothetical protein
MTNFEHLRDLILTLSEAPDWDVARLGWSVAESTTRTSRVPAAAEPRSRNRPSLRPLGSGGIEDSRMRKLCGIATIRRPTSSPYPYQKPRRRGLRGNNGCRR